ncbi:MAG: RND family transporter [Deltaproteobacteria bacterium]|nr:RND family transporter [Deltaproteobacteria bacterium]
MNSYVSIITRYPKKILFILAIISLLFGYHASQVRMDNRMEVWFPEKNPALVQYKTFLEDFGTEEYILIAFPLPDGLTQKHLLLTDRLSKELKKEPGIRRVFSVTELFDNPWDYIELFKQIITTSSFARHILISPDGKVSGIIILLSEQGLKDRINLLQNIKDIVSENIQDGSTRFYIAGPPAVNAEVDSLAQQNAMTHYPILFVLCLLMLFIIFRSLAGIGAPSLMMGFAVLITVGWMGILNGSLNMITITVLPLVMVISLAYAIYFYNDYYTYLSQNISTSEDLRKAAVIKAFRHVSYPLFLSALTTAVGFSSLTISDIVPVHDLGLFVALGVSSAFLLAVTLLPILLLMFPQPNKGQKRRAANAKFAGMLTAISRLALTSKKQIFIFSCIIGIIAAVGVTRIGIETDALLYFPKDNPIVQAYHFIEKNFTALSPVEIIIEPEESLWDDQMPDPETIDKIKNLQQSLSEMDEIVTSKSIVDIRDDKVGAAFLKINAIPNERLLEGLNTAAGYFINSGGTKTRVSVRVKTLASERFQEVVENIEKSIKTHFKDGQKAYVTGIVPILVEMQTELLKNLIQSFLIAFSIIFCIFLFLLRSLKTALICMAGNLLPILVILGVMGWAGIKLDLATVLIGSIAIGIAVDDTVHFIMRLKRESSGAENLSEPILSTLLSTGKAIVCTSLVILCGFIVLCFSDFKPMQNFGLLTGITIIIAIISDLVMLPAMLSMFINKPGGDRKRWI